VTDVIGAQCLHGDGNGRRACVEILNIQQDFLAEGTKIYLGAKINIL
jgi:hypothetical protein